MTPEEAAGHIRLIRPSALFGTREIKRLYDFVECLKSEYDKQQREIKEKTRSS